VSFLDSSPDYINISDESSGMHIYSFASVCLLHKLIGIFSGLYLDTKAFCKMHKYHYIR